MNIIALILAILAIVVFVCAYLAVSRKWANTNLGLAFLAAAWVAELIFVGLHQYAIH